LLVTSFAVYRIMALVSRYVSCHGKMNRCSPMTKGTEFNFLYNFDAKLQQSCWHGPFTGFLRSKLTDDPMEDGAIQKTGKPLQGVCDNVLLPCAASDTENFQSVCSWKLGNRIKIGCNAFKWSIATSNVTWLTLYMLT